MASFLVTGGAGFIGSHLVRGLLERGHHARVLDDLSSGSLDNLRDLSPGPLGSGAPLEFVRAGLQDPPRLREACRGVQGIFHEAAQVSVPHSVKEPRASFATNATGTLNVLEAAREEGVQRVVFAASSAAYGETEALPKVESMLPTPLSPYAVGKVAGEALLAAWGRVYGLRTVSLRYFNIFGPGQRDDSPYTGVIALFARALLERRAPTIFGDGEQTRDFTYVDNVVAANLLAMERDLEPGVVINVGAGARVSLNQLWRAMGEIEGVDIAPQYAPPRAGDVRHSLASLERARALLGYAPRVDWRTGLERTLAWYRERARAAS